MSTLIKTPDEIQKMRIAGKLAADVLTMITPYVKPGVTTAELDQRCHDYIVNTQQAYPASLGYQGFPKSMCTSINHVVCHGIPSDKALKNGDIMNVDVVVRKDEYHGDTSKMFIVGKAPLKAIKLVSVTQECLYLGIKMVKPGASLKAIGAAIANHAHAHQFSVVREYCGHGIGSRMHEGDFQVLHYEDPNVPDITLEPGMTFTIEPMINAGKRHTKVLPDQWTVVTKDKALSAQWEHTLLVTDTGVEILTAREEEDFSFLNN